ncbi:arylamine N-acetyltransferase [Longimycelium tulufanense]|uniref:Arylamine N-acetyltransferase n=1 Tax=Longimycelium tulufanense TaxID=907463 RepID=A0A8J3CEC0_9PSEU|nr:arylamine N-acetyltransferase [Longimycelium tulufanense]GGM62318.1 arylamine N-acetyltransferase [Longimycelium tulufanense]
MTDTQWDSERLDLASYLARLGIDEPTEPNASALRALHRAHVAAIPFENVEIALGRPISVDLDDIQDKLVHRRRGGYCMEHTPLFAAVLERLGYSVTGLGGRVLMGTNKIRPATHALLRVDLEDGPWLADVGFGGQGLLEPIPIVDGTEVDQGGWVFRLDTDEAGTWMFRTRHPEGGFNLYSFTLEPRYLVDYVVANHYTSTHPRSPFVNRLMAQRTEPGVRHRLMGTEFATVRTKSNNQTRTLPAEELPDTLRKVFGIALDPTDEQALVEQYSA